MRHTRLLLLALIVVGCGSGGGGSAPATVNLNPIGKYSLTYTKTGGTCSDITSSSPVTISQVDATHWLWTQAATTPTGGIVLCDPEKCTFTVSSAVSFPVNVNGVTFTTTGTGSHAVTITQSGMTGTMSFSGALKDPLSATVATCSGAYSVLGPRLTTKPEGEPIPAPFEHE